MGIIIVLTYQRRPAPEISVVCLSVFPEGGAMARAGFGLPAGECLHGGQHRLTEIKRRSSQQAHITSHAYSQAQPSAGSRGIGGLPRCRVCFHLERVHRLAATWREERPPRYDAARQLHAGRLALWLRLAIRCIPREEAAEDHPQEALAIFGRNCPESRSVPRNPSPHPDTCVTGRLLSTPSHHTIGRRRRCLRFS